MPSVHFKVKKKSMLISKVIERLDYGTKNYKSTFIIFSKRMPSVRFKVKKNLSTPAYM